MRDPNQDSDAAQSGRPEGNDDDELGAAEAVPKAIDVEVSLEHAAPDAHPDRKLERADTDWDKPRDERGGLRSAERPSRVTLALRPVASLTLRCFFCWATDCDATFRVYSHRDTQTFAAHSRCVFDHEELQRIALEGK